MGSVADVSGAVAEGRVTDLEIRSALALLAVQGLGPARLRALIDHFGSAAAALRFAAVEPPPGLSAAHRERLRRLRPMLRARVEELEARGIWLVSYRGPGYPERLCHLHHPPIVLYGQGPLRLPRDRMITVVGTRRATEYGRRVASDIGSGLARAGWCVVSGMARGIDAAAHRGALEGGGATLGILGGGLDHPFPAVNRALFGRLREQGALVSECAPSVPPSPGLFPRRNRILAALADVVVVVQAGVRSGALITVRHALEIGREVGAVPGPVGSPGSEGVHALLRDGAHVVTSAEDVLALVGEEAPWMGAAAMAGDEGAMRSCPEARLLQGLADGIVGADELAEAASLDIGEALAALSELELAGDVRSMPGARYQLVHTGPAGDD